MLRFLLNLRITKLIQVAHYGLPAAGIISLAMLRSPSQPGINDKFPEQKVIQDLGVLVAEIQVGGLVQAGEPNYALLHRAAGTIQSILKTFHATKRTSRTTGGERDSEDPVTTPEIGETSDANAFNSFIQTESWGNEYEFWENLAAHPSILVEDNLLDLLEV